MTAVGHLAWYRHVRTTRTGTGSRFGSTPDYLIDWLLYRTPTRPSAHPLEYSHVQVIRSRFVLSVLT